MIRGTIGYAIIAAILFAVSASAGEPEQIRISRECALTDLDLFTEIEIAREEKQPVVTLVLAQQFLMTGRKLCLAREDEKAITLFRSAIRMLQDRDMALRQTGD